MSDFNKWFEKSFGDLPAQPAEIKSKEQAVEGLRHKLAQAESELRAMKIARAQYDAAKEAEKSRCKELEKKKEKKK